MSSKPPETEERPRRSTFVVLDEDEDDPRRRPKNRTKPSEKSVSPMLLWGGIGGIGLVCLLVLVVGVVLLTRKPKAEGLAQNADNKLAPAAVNLEQGKPAAAVPQVRFQAPASVPPKVATPQVRLKAPTSTPAPTTTPQEGVQPPNSVPPEITPPLSVPSKVTPQERFQAPPAAPPKGPEWAGGLVMMFARDKEPTLGPTGCPAALAGAQVYDLLHDKQAGELTGYTEDRGHRALSQDGRWFACCTKTPNIMDTNVDVWSTESGQKLLTVPGKPGEFTDFIAFAGEGLLFVGGRSSPEIRVWDVQQKKQVKAFAVKNRRVEFKNTAISPNGKHVAMVAHDHIEILQIDTGKIVANLMPEPPTSKSKAGRNLEGVFVMAWLNHLSFSPDGSEVIMTSTNPEPHVNVWDSKGKLVFKMAVPSANEFGKAYQVDWLPDQSGWLIGRALIDRASKQMLLRVDAPIGFSHPPRLIDGNRIALEVNNQYHFVPIPWEALRATLAQLKAGAPALLSPASPVQLKVDVAEARGDVAETQKLLSEAIIKRLNRDGIQVSEKGTTVVQVRLAEAAGEQMPIVEQSSPFDRRGRPTGKSATEAMGSLVVEILAPGDSTPLWRTTLSAGNSRSFREEVTEAAVRKSMLDNAAMQIGRIDMPFYIPADKNLTRLPAILE